MKAVWYERTGAAPDVLTFGEMPTPTAGPGEVRVKVEAASLNFPDLLMVKGQYQFKPDPPFVVGMDLAGVVDATGPGVTTFIPGARVAGGAKTGAFAEYAVCPASSLHVVPDDMASPLAAAYPAAYTTAYVSLVSRARLQSGETLLVHGASGGVGMATIDVGRLLGARQEFANHMADDGRAAQATAHQQAKADLAHLVQ